MQRGHLPRISLACPTLVTTACSVGPNYKICDRLAKRVSLRRDGRPVPHPSPVEAA